MLEETSQLIAKLHSELNDEYPFLESWCISFDNAKRRAGVCKMSSKEISFSVSHIENNSIEIIRDTILHEFAHAIAFEMYGHAGHGQPWKNIAQKIGATPRAKGVFNLPSAPWVLVHACNKTLIIQPIGTRFRRNKKIKDYFLIGKPETKGELFFIEHSEYNLYKQGLLERSRLVLFQ